MGQGFIALSDLSDLVTMCLLIEFFITSLIFSAILSCLQVPSGTLQPQAVDRPSLANSFEQIAHLHAGVETLPPRSSVFPPGNTDSQNPAQAIEWVSWPWGRSGSLRHYLGWKRQERVAAI